MAEIILDQIFKIYDNQKTAVHNFNLHIADKEFIVLVGPSGCGKSTTLRMVAGLEEITTGALYIDGKRMNEIPPKDRDIAMVFQNYALYPHMTVYDNLAFGLKLRKVSTDEIKKRVKETSKILGLEAYINRKPKALSGGQRQRVALGRAIIRDAKLFLLDEPLSNLDAKLRVQMRMEIAKLHQRLQTTTIYVTHDQTEAMTLATRLVVMSEGIIHQIGTPKEVYEQPKNIFVAGFIGSPTMNFLLGIVEDGFFRIGTVTFFIPDEKMKILRSQQYVGKKAVLGIRPEDFLSDPEFEVDNLGTRITIMINGLELTGADTMIYSYIEKQNFLVRLASRKNVHQGDLLDLAIDMNRTHFFDPTTQMRIQ